ncbi:protein FAM180A-like [Seriola dumerili]|uniref:protein FAM180A-like n=1 Tax=Seriola dumerili TaxID=41447 RepID=UPI000BBE9A00|nr:protein FAM180A-like [Seriola dumerili]XP_022605639.1 protein FAM180A-like [Seriola dumerili]XP_022605641.1 protein FAM180A-like [Seriola dumerili]
MATMLPWRMIAVGLFYCYIKAGVTQCRTKALFPAASRIKRGVAHGVNPSFHNSFDDVHLLFEILLAGVHFDANGEFSVKDAELASLRKTRNLEVICEETVPRKLTDIFRLISGLSNRIGRLHQEDFERTLLTLVYIAQQMVNATTEHQRDVWAESFVSLYKAVKQDLTGTN